MSTGVLKNKEKKLYNTKGKSYLSSVFQLFIKERVFLYYLFYLSPKKKDLINIKYLSFVRTAYPLLIQKFFLCWV